ncbi:hypothetical protein LJC49_03455 [Ruminococcaceae bacterium OttesenSCG-928-I18]|nr:hypothetical protein [Ruminococcaceae bacterium OttesenSCG-928-I18]
MDYRTLKTRTLFLRYVIPNTFAIVCNSVYFIVDGVFIGHRLGPTALAAAGVAVPVVECTIAVAMMLSVGTGVLISSAAGRGQQALARNIFNYSAVFTLVLSLFVAVVGAIFTAPIARFMGASGQLVPMTVEYLRTFLIFCPFLVFSYALSCYVRNDGGPTVAMVSLVVGSAANVILDWVFMYPLNMGLFGAALATGLGPVFSVLILLPHFLRKKGMLYFQRPTRMPGVLRSVVTGGMPAFVTEFSIGLTTLLYNLAIVRQGLGEAGLTIYMVLHYAVLICITAFLGAAQGIQPPVSFFTGAGEKDRVRKLVRVSVVFVLGLAALFYVGLFFGGQFFYGIFLAPGELLQQTTAAGQIYFLYLLFAAVNIMLTSVLQAMGKAVSSLVLSLCRCTLPLALLLFMLPGAIGINGLWLACTFAEALTLIPAILSWRKAAADQPKAVLAPKGNLPKEPVKLSAGKTR